MEELPDPTQEPDSCNLVRQTYLLFEKDFELSPELSDYPASYQLLKERIASVICQLVEHDPRRLVNLMYKMDIDERKFQQAISQPSIDIVAEEIAQLVLDREKQKVYWRNKYNKK